MINYENKHHTFKQINKRINHNNRQANKEMELSKYKIMNAVKLYKIYNFINNNNK